jgi:hypothetical protein
MQIFKLAIMPAWKNHNLAALTAKLTTEARRHGEKQKKFAANGR